MRNLSLVLLLVGCSQEYDIIGEGNGNPFLEDGPNFVVDDDVALAEVYAHTSTALYAVDPETGDLDFQGNFHNATEALEGFVDVAINLDGHLYGGTFERLYTIEPSTGLVTPVCSLDFEPFAMAFGPNGVLYAGSSDNQLFEVNTTNCSTRLLVAAAWTTAGDIVGLPDGFIYWTVRGDGNNAPDELVRVDPATGNTEWMGVTGADSIYGVGYADGNLYGFTSDGETAVINPANGETEILSTSESLSWWGATTNPVRW